MSTTHKPAVSQRAANHDDTQEKNQARAKTGGTSQAAAQSAHLQLQRNAQIGIQQSPYATAQRQQIAALMPPLQRNAEADAPKMDEEEAPSTVQPKAADSVKRLDEEEQVQPAQTKVASATVQREAEAPAKRNDTGLPDNLKSGIESLSGMSMDSVKVHYNSEKPAQLNALAYAQGTDIHVAPGQEQHLPHEAWHVVQQAQGRVQPTMQMKAGVPVNDDPGLEHEADAMGARALAVSQQDVQQVQRQPNPSAGDTGTYQLVKASKLVKLGKQWSGKIWMNKNAKKKSKKETNITRSIQKLTGFNTGTVFHPHDLYVRGKGPSKYVDIVKKFGKPEAEEFRAFLKDEVKFNDLAEELRKLAVIVCVSETGRGYDVKEMVSFMDVIVSGKSNWKDIKREYSPSLTYDEDANKSIGEYKPENDEMEESDEYDEDISEEEMRDLNNNIDKEKDLDKEKELKFGTTRSGKDFKSKLKMGSDTN